MLKISVQVCKYGLNSQCKYGIVKLIQHRNQQKHFRSTTDELKCIYAPLIDIDFSENLSVPIKNEPQSLHWCHQQVSVHSGIVKEDGDKIYHAYISNDRLHDQAFVEILKECNLPKYEAVIIISHNCSNQYKSGSAFHDLQGLANTLNKPIIRVYGIAGHGNGEVDHVGVRREIAAGCYMADAGEMVEFLSDKFSLHDNEIDEKALEMKRAAKRMMTFPTINGSSKFQIMCFKPNALTFRAAPFICVCEECQKYYGSCSLFHEYPLNV